MDRFGGLTKLSGEKALMSVRYEVQVQSDALVQNVYLLIPRIKSDNVP